MNTKGMIIDTAHMNHQTMMEVLATSSKPVLNSHSNLMHYASHTRNVADEFLDALAKNGGVLGLSVYRGFMKSLDSHLTRVDYMDQIAYVIDRIGSEYVALGTDFHGLPTKHCVHGLSHIGHLVALEQEMIARFGVERTEQFFWHNAMRVLRANLPHA